MFAVTEWSTLTATFYAEEKLQRKDTQYGVRIRSGNDIIVVHNKGEKKANHALFRMIDENDTYVKNNVYFD